MDVDINSDAAKLKRKKFNKVCVRIRKQLEFYFSDSNLSKDKYLNDLISKDPHGYVDVEVFKSFNKIKVLIDNSEIDSCLLIATAAGRSNMFEVSADHRRLRRITPRHAKDFDACTLYVEKLPLHANQTWVQDKFCSFGVIHSINVPRFRATNKVKGFAFVEFENDDSVKKACEFFKLPSEKECSASEDESKNVKNVKKSKNEDISDKKNKSRTRSISESSDKISDFSSLKSDQHPDTTEKNMDSDHSQKNKKKRKREDSDSESPTKKPKESTAEDPSTSVIKSKEPKMEQSDLKEEDKPAHTQPKEHEANITDEEKVSEIQDCDMTEIEKKESKSKRRRRKKHHRPNQEQLTLRVMPKNEWKVYRNKYLELQRTTMKFAKQQILFEIQEWKEQDSHVKSMDISEPKKAVQFVPDVIIKIELPNQVKNSSEMRDQVKSNAVVHLAYIDVPVDSTEVFIRCHNSDDALTIIKEEKLSQLGKTELLKGDEEKTYWEKIENDRKAKYANHVPHKKRGRDKLLAKAAKLEEMKNKHIFFDD